MRFLVQELGYSLVCSLGPAALPLGYIWAGIIFYSSYRFKCSLQPWVSVISGSGLKSIVGCSSFAFAAAAASVLLQQQVYRSAASYSWCVRLVHRFLPICCNLLAVAMVLGAALVVSWLVSGLLGRFAAVIIAADSSIIASKLQVAGFVLWSSC
ncbi:hypothetical protein U1Q18_015426 [Sarracenia purpurea var. burkii]